ncbi:zinc finger protein, putative [Ixodes scapularis]|uniref:Zinc finger protein, putative n=1 Tax=Ixodes scapularis TaxID=6945 RepID=B7Q2D3_IXOSC|nr:zinc finger protein, putative [Ixodes scapularis]|eukprot:XP_002410699.1 zinc finger protein, putative [Ixodes scapularis]
MQQHSREAHRGELKPHQCGQCLKSFSSTHQLAQHVRIHTGEKPYKCSYCERRFKQLSHVQQHTRLHTGKHGLSLFFTSTVLTVVTCLSPCWERPYKCHLPECGRAFIQLSNLQQHLRNHDSQMERAKSRPFHCNICGKGFASDSSLRTHRSKQHAALIGGAASQSCPICHKICVNAEALMEHMRANHRELQTSSAAATAATPIKCSIIFFSSVCQLYVLVSAPISIVSDKGTL